MPGPGKNGRYHHGNLRAALIDTAVELIGERGLRGFSLTEASRQLGVAVSAPYAHFTDREDLLAAVAVRAFGLLAEELVGGTAQIAYPADRLAAMTRAYVHFAAAHRPLFEVLYEAGLDKERHPEIGEAERPVTDAILACVTDVAGDRGDPDELAGAIEATAYGHVALLLGHSGRDAADVAAAAARATLALVTGRHLLVPSPAS